ncbi:hypothetical protein [Nonomuraea typhae]|uniref:hypothetical protein n=1 Tax=Nonomuraea typhae TaxID=2603600 RepID=UPI0012FBF717|nr:hypothetical protein [Nonomuraea typhae]
MLFSRDPILSGVTFGNLAALRHLPPGMRFGEQPDPLLALIAGQLRELPRDADLDEWAVENHAATCCSALLRREWEQVARRFRREPHPDDTASVDLVRAGEQAGWTPELIETGDDDLVAQLRTVWDQPDLHAALRRFLSPMPMCMLSEYLAGDEPAVSPLTWVLAHHRTTAVGEVLYLIAENAIPAGWKSIGVPRRDLRLHLTARSARHPVTVTGLLIGSVGIEVRAHCRLPQRTPTGDIKWGGFAEAFDDQGFRYLMGRADRDTQLGPVAQFRREGILSRSHRQYLRQNIYPCPPQGSTALTLISLGHSRAEYPGREWSAEMILSSEPDRTEVTIPIIDSPMDA